MSGSIFFLHVYMRYNGVNITPFIFTEGLT